MLLTACFIVGLVIPYAISDPRTSAYIIYDATISNAGYDNFKPSVPNFVPVLVPLLTFAITVVVGELISSKSQHNTVTEAVASALFFVLDGIQVGMPAWPCLGRAMLIAYRASSCKLQSLLGCHWPAMIHGTRVVLVCAVLQPAGV